MPLWESYSITVIAYTQFSRQHRHYSLRNGCILWVYSSYCALVPILLALTWFLSYPPLTRWCTCKCGTEVWTWWFQIKTLSRLNAESDVSQLKEGINAKYRKSPQRDVCVFTSPEITFNQAVKSLYTNAKWNSFEINIHGRNRYC